MLFTCVAVTSAALHGQEVPDPSQTLSQGTRWTYVSEVFPLELKWRRHLESNLRWMIAEERQSPRRARLPDVGLFVDAGTNHKLNRNIVTILNSLGIRVQLFDRSALNKDKLNGLQAFIVPGGYSTFQNAASGRAGRTAIHQYVSEGGRYLGICAGAYMASKDVLWEKEHFPYPLQLFDGTAEGALDRIARWPTDSGVSLTLTALGRSRGLENSAEGEFYYKGGPRFEGGTQSSVLAEYEDGSAAIIVKPLGQGEVVLNGIHFERPPPLADADSEDVPAPDASASSAFRALLKLQPGDTSARPVQVPSVVTDWLEIRDLAREDRINLEENLRWLLDRIPRRRQIVSKARVGVFADAGVEHTSLVRIAQLLDGHGIQFQPLLHTDMRAEKLKPLTSLIMPAGDHRILRDCLAESGQQELRRFVERGGQFLGLSTSAYMAASEVRWFGRSWEYPLEFHKAAAEGPLQLLVPWPGFTEVGLRPTAEGIRRSLSRAVLAQCQYHGGPRFEETPGCKVLARYPDDSAAIVAHRIGRGEAILAGVDISRPLANDADAKFLYELLTSRISR